jgi:hypothetical protein
MKKLPLINSSNKGVKIVGYVVYIFVFLMILSAILPSNTENTSTTSSTSNENSASSKVLSHSVFGNYTFDGQDEVTATLKKGTDVVHMMAMEELPTDYGYSKDGAQYTITSTGTHIKGYIDYSSDGYVVIMKPKKSSLTKGEFMDILNTFKRVD